MLGYCCSTCLFHCYWSSSRYLMKTLTINNLLYEELIMLQDIMKMIEFTDFTTNLDTTEREIYADLYEKVMQS